MYPSAAKVGSSKAKAKSAHCQRGYHGFSLSQKRNPIMAWTQAMISTVSCSTPRGGLPNKVSSTVE